jgi:hypothetical protein
MLNFFRPRPYSTRIVQGRDGFGNQLFAIQMFSPNSKTWVWKADEAQAGTHWVRQPDHVLIFHSREGAETERSRILIRFREDANDQNGGRANCEIKWG